MIEEIITTAFRASLQREEGSTMALPKGIALVPVVDMKVRMPFNLIWKKDNSSPVVQKFIAQVKAL